MRAYPLILLVIVGGCSFGEVAGLYDLPETAQSTGDGTYPTLIPESELAVAPIDTAEATVALAELTARANAQRAAADALAAPEIATGDTLTAAGQALAARAEASRVRAGL